MHNAAWKRLFVLPVLAAAVLGTALPGPCRAAQQAQTRFCTFVYSQQEAPAARYLMRYADPVVRELAGSLGFEPRGRIRVVLTSDFHAFAKAQPEGARVPSWAVGTAYPLKNLIVLFKKPGTDLVRTFRHETSHVLLGQLFRGRDRVPRWLNEGLAMIRAGEWNFSRLAAMTGAVLTDSLIPMNDIVESFPLKARDAELAYCQSFYFISFLKGEFGPEAFHAFLQEYSKHANFKWAIMRTYHVSWIELESRWQKYLALRFSWIPILTSTGTLWFAAALVFVWGYVRKRRKARQKLRQWGVEDALQHQPESPTKH